MEVPFPTELNVVCFQVGGNILIVYNMGSLNHPVGDMFAKMNDGQYHVVRFRRSGPNATLQVDDRAPQTKNPIGMT